MNRASVVTSLRHAGNVKRYHTHPTLRTQTVADHSWHVMRIFMELFPDAVTVEVLTYILWHDTPEIGTGDLPFPVKATHPALRAEITELEQEVSDNLGIVWPELTTRQRLLVKVCDLLEMTEFGCEEYTMGNKYAVIIIEDTVHAVLPIAKELGILDIIEMYVRGLHGFESNSIFDKEHSS